MNRHFIILLALAILATAAPGQEEASLARALRDFDAQVIAAGKMRENPLAPMLARDAKAQLRLANSRDAKAWAAVKTKGDWEAFRDRRIDALKKALGTFPPPKDEKARVTRTHSGDKYAVDNLLFEGRPGVTVTANLYWPKDVKASMPGILIVHSHHRPKNVGVRQDMAMTWARAGCVVIVPDLLGHGERRLHPFVSERSFGEPFRLDMQDYWFRYDLGMQLHLLGDSLMGWLAYDLSRSVDVLLARKGVDPKRIIVVSEPAGGGDVAAVSMALDQRITAGVITNFGGPQPESPYPLPRDAEDSFDYAGSGSWESTRNLTNSARDGFLPWVIVASVAPRKLIYNHEFYWDRDNDPVWKRLRKVYSFYDAAGSLAGVAGRGFVSGPPPSNTHWLPINRELLYPIFERWFGIANPMEEFNRRLPESNLDCLRLNDLREFQAHPVHETIEKLGHERVSAVRARLAKLKPDERRQQLRKDWARLLGGVEPSAGARRVDFELEDVLIENVRIERHHLSVEPGIAVPLIVLIPRQPKPPKLPLVVGLAQEGKQAFLKKRPETIAALLQSGVAVALPDVRGTGETSPGAGRDRRAPATAFSSTSLMTGDPLLGARLRDLRSVLRYLRGHPDIDAKRIALWGDSLAEPYEPDFTGRVPHGIDKRPEPCEPLAGLLALFGALYEDDIRAVFVYGGLASFASALEDPFCYVPHDCIVPGALTAGDVCDLAAALAPRPIRLTQLVDGHNRRLTRLPAEKAFAPARAAYRAVKAEAEFLLEPEPPNGNQIARWLAGSLRGD